ncbi:hypothetical protein JCM33774_38760 [Actinophytocola sp. KF-1]
MLEGGDDADEVEEFGGSSAVAGGEDFPVLPVSDSALDRDPQADDAAVPDLGGRVMLGVTGPPSGAAGPPWCLIAQVTAVGASETLVDPIAPMVARSWVRPRNWFGRGQELTAQVGQDLTFSPSVWQSASIVWTGSTAPPPASAQPRRRRAPPPPRAGTW